MNIFKTVVQDCCEKVQPQYTVAFYYLHIQQCQLGNPRERWKAWGGVWPVKGINWVSQSVSWNVTAAGVWAKQWLLLGHGQENKTARLHSLCTGGDTRPHMHIHAPYHANKYTHISKILAKQMCMLSYLHSSFLKYLHSWKYLQATGIFPALIQHLL